MKTQIINTAYKVCIGIGIITGSIAIVGLITHWVS